MNVKRLEQLSLFALLCSVVWIFYWLIKAALYSHPNAEDLSLSHPTFNQGRWLFIRHTLATYDGRYFVNLLHTITPLAFGYTKGYPLVAILGICGLISSSLFFFDTIFEAKFTHLFLLTFLFCGVHFATTPSIVHQLYWMSSSLVYLWCWIFLFGFLGSSIRLLTTNNELHRNIWLVLSHLTLFAAIGINEMMLPAVSILIGTYLYICRKTLSSSKNLLSLVISGFLFIGFFVISPGINERLVIEHNPERSLSLASTVMNSIKWYAYFVFDFLVNPLVLMTGFVLVAFASHFHCRIKVNFLFKDMKMSHLFIIALVTTFLMTLTYYLPIRNQDLYPARIYNTVAVLLLLLFFGVVLLVAKNVHINQLVKMWAAFFFLVVCIVASNNINQIRIGFKNGEIQEYSLAMKNRNKLLEQTKNSTACYRYTILPVIENYPKSIALSTDIAPNRLKAHWNLAYELYYDVDGVFLANDSGIAKLRISQ